MPKGQDLELAELENVIAKYRVTVATAGYERLIHLLTGVGITENMETACKIGHMLKEMGLV